MFGLRLAVWASLHAVQAYLAPKASRLSSCENKGVAVWVLCLKEWVAESVSHTVTCSFKFKFAFGAYSSIRFRSEAKLTYCWSSCPEVLRS